MAKKLEPIRSRGKKTAFLAGRETALLPLILAFLFLATPLCAQQTNSNASSNSASPAGNSALPRGNKLILKDGSFHLVREYQVVGDRVRYYSTERSQWEEIPADLVDWNATKAAGSAQAQRDAAVVAKVHKDEENRLAQPLDIDASLEVAPGIFLPPGTNLFVFDGKDIVSLTQAETTAKLAKGHFLEQVLIPVPVVSTRHTISIQGPRAKRRIVNTQPEFYIRTADARTPELELIRTKIRGANRQIENIDALMGQQHASGQDAVALQAWEVAHGVYRFTLGKALASGEYVVAEIVRDEGMSMYVWDFGADTGTAPAPQKK